MIGAAFVATMVNWIPPDYAQWAEPEWETAAPCGDQQDHLPAVVELLTAANADNWARFDELVSDDIEVVLSESDLVDGIRTDERGLRLLGAPKQQAFEVLKRHQFFQYSRNVNTFLCMNGEGAKAVSLQLLAPRNMTYLVRFDFEEDRLVRVNGRGAFMEKGVIGGSN